MELLNWLLANTDVIVAVTALLALILSAVSIWLTYITLRDQRTHNRISVRPIAHIGISDFENKVSVRIENRGTGPLIINSFQATVDRQSKPDVIEWMPTLPDGVYWKTFTQRFEGAAILPEKDLNLVEFAPNLNNPQEILCRDEIRKSLSKIKVRMTYSDIYGQSMPPAERALDWFGRHFQ